MVTYVGKQSYKRKLLDTSEKTMELFDPFSLQQKLNG